MIEVPEAAHLSRQLSEPLAGKRIESVVSGSSPHGFAWYWGDRDSYVRLARGKVFRSARAVAGMVEGNAREAKFLFSDGANLRLLAAGSSQPPKHQFLMRFEDGTALVVSIRMYGAMGVVPGDWSDNPYYRVSQAKPSPLTKEFDERYFRALFDEPGIDKLTAKALLATEQRIPELGNGVLQDMLFRARINPRARVGDLAAAQRKRLFRAVTQTLRAMADAGGRDTELDLDGKQGGYVTVMSRTGAARPCPGCGGAITKESYFGGSVYFCPGCQPL